MGDVVHVASVSGGKDSTAMCLHLIEQGVEFHAVHFDTGWEHPDTATYVREVLPGIIGREVRIEAAGLDLPAGREAEVVEIEKTLGHRSDFVRLCVAKGAFPGRKRRFCTETLKIRVAQRVMAAHHAAGRLPVSVVGVRAQESEARAQLPERELSPTLDCMVWRPLIDWCERDVIDIHKRHGIAPNPLYLRGARRVGCWPCIHARKAELRMLDEGRLNVVEKLERVVAEVAAERARSKGKQLRNPPALFQRSLRLPDGTRPCVPIRDMVQWAHTTHGGRRRDNQVDLPGFNDGCLRWGMCHG